MGIYDRQIARAKQVIAKYGQACVWKKPAARAAGAEPWRDTRDGDPSTYPVSIAWFPPGRRNPFLALIAKTEVPEASEVGIMGAYDGFEPEINDTIDRGGWASTILHIDKLAPNGTPIMYTVSVKNPGQGSGF